MGAPFFMVRPAWRVPIGCKSRTRPSGGSVSRAARVSPERWNLKEAEVKSLARRTEIAYEAALRGKLSITSKAQILTGTQ